MAFITDITWGRDLTPEERRRRDDKSNEFVLTGVTDGVAQDVIGHRVWTTEEAAQAWVDFVNTFTPPPVSTNIIEE